MFYILLFLEAAHKSPEFFLGGGGGLGAAKIEMISGKGKFVIFGADIYRF